MGSCPTDWTDDMIEFLPLMCVMFCIILITSSYFLLVGPSLLFLSVRGVLWLSLSGNTWLGIILFLVYIGGILVLFTYFLSLTQDFPVQRTIYLSPLAVVGTIFYYNAPYTGPTSTFIVVNNAVLSCYIISGLWLFFAIVVVVKLRAPNLGPLRRIAC